MGSFGLVIFVGFWFVLLGGLFGLVFLKKIFFVSLGKTG